MAQLVIANDIPDDEVARIVAAFGTLQAARTAVRAFIDEKVRAYETTQMLARKDREVTEALAAWSGPFEVVR